MINSILKSAIVALAIWLTATASSAAESTNRPNGLIVVVGCDEPSFLIAESSGGGIVHAIDNNPAHIESAAARIREANLGGKIALGLWQGGRLPYADNLVNFLIVRPGQTVPESEILRVLTPGGSADVHGKTLTKARPEQMDDWPQYLYDSTGQSMSKDLLVGPPKSVQWIGDPKWTRSHESYSSFGAMVSAGGRIFYIVDECPVSSTTLPPQFNLVARDAFNGIILWRKPLEKWLSQHFPWKQGPFNLLRLLVATETELYAPVGIDGDLVAYDTQSGRELRRYAGIKAPEELVLADKTLLVVANPTPPDYDKIAEDYDKIRLTNECFDGARGKISLFNQGVKHLVAFDPEGKEIWRKESVVIPLTLASDGKVCVFHDGNKLQCLNLSTGKTLWETEHKLNTGQIMTAVPPSLAIFKNHVILLAEKKLTSYTLSDGKLAWEQKGSETDYASPASLNFLHGLVWDSDLTNRNGMGKFIGYDPATGQQKLETKRDSETVFAHPRCHRSKATERYVLTGTSGVEFFDPIKNTYQDHNWIRGACTYGIMPAYGLLYVPPTSCACNPEEKFNGFTAFSPTSPEASPQSTERLVKGPAYGKAQGTNTPFSPQDWPIFRHDYFRGNLSEAQMPIQYAPAWNTALGGPLSALVAAEGVVLVSRKTANEVVCLKQQTGVIEWRLTTGGPVDSPPTVSGGKAFFGCSDGYVYCVALKDGALVWKFRAAPQERLIVAHERIESAWPVCGSVVVKNNAVFAVAGRSSFLDNGLFFVRLNAETGQLEKEIPITSEALYALSSEKEKPVFGTGALQDILIESDGNIFLRNLKFDEDSGKFTNNEESKHLIAFAGILDENWHHRHFLSFGALDGKSKGRIKGFIGYHRWNDTGNSMISGRLMAFDSESVFGFGRNYYPGMNSRQFVNGEDYHLYRAPINQEIGPEKRQMMEKMKAKRSKAFQYQDRNRDWSAYNEVIRDWLIRPPFDAYALIVVNRKEERTGALYKTILICGPNGDTQNSLDARLGRTGGQIQCYDAEKGDLLGTSKLGDIVPVFDGMIAAQGRLFLAGMDGSIHCLAGQPKP